MSSQPSFSGDVHIYYGPPGTGKTEKLLEDLQRELITVPPEQILCTSFTREGARQLIRRALGKFPQYKLDMFPYARTWHSLGFHALNLSKEQVMGRTEYREFSKRIGMSFSGYFMEDAHSRDDKYMFFIDVLRNNRDLAAHLLEELDPFTAKYVFMQYQEYKKQMKVLDFTDMITGFIQKGESLPVKVAFMDEAQDYTTLHWRMADLACRGCERIYIAGDDDQAIYQWSGADVGIFMGLQGDKKVLGVSHRFGEGIRKFATGISDNIGTRISKDYRGKDDSGTVQWCQDFYNVPLDNPGSYLFLFRNIRFIQYAEEMLQSKGLLYATDKGMSASQADLDAIRGWTEYLSSGKITESGKLRIQTASGMPLEQMDRKPWRDVFTNWDYMKCDYLGKLAERYGDLTNAEVKYTLRTIHTTKGSEADNVVLFTGMSRITYDSFIEDPDPEHRVWYVAVTRARNFLYLVRAEDDENYPLYGGTKNNAD